MSLFNLIGSIFIMSLFAGLGVAWITIEKVRRGYYKNIVIQSQKLANVYWMLLKWLQISRERRRISFYFLKNHYHVIAIYGMGDVGKLLLREIEKTEIQVKYGIDIAADVVHSTIEIYKPDEDLGDVDVIVVTVINQFDAIEAKLKKTMKCPIVSIEDILWDV